MTACFKMVKSSRILEYHRLTDGSILRIRKWGKEFQFEHSSADIWCPPTFVYGTKQECLKLFADAIRDDVLEISD